jgi:hypothetical protein
MFQDHHNLSVNEPAAAPIFEDYLNYFEASYSDMDLDGNGSDHPA